MAMISLLLFLLLPYNPGCTLWLLLAVLIQSQHISAHKNRDNKHEQDVAKTEDASELHSCKNDLVLFTSLSWLLVSHLSEKPGFPASSEPH